MDFVTLLAREFSLKETHVANIITLIDEGNTLPFIARYRKELTGTIDDQVLRALSERLQYLRNFEKRREEIRDAIASQDKLTDELSAALDKAVTLSELEDVYRPFKKKRTTRASIARERGLESLAAILFAGDGSLDLDKTASAYVDEEKGVPDTAAAIQGAMDIIAEDLSDDAALRKKLRIHLFRNASLVTEKKKDEDSVYTMYYDHSEPVSKVASHRVLAINRGEKEEFLKVTLDCPEGPAKKVIFDHISLDDRGYRDYVRTAAEDAYDRLIFPSLERELRSDMTGRANTGAIKNFAVNLKPLLMQPPVKNTVTLGLDPAYRTGCKLAVVDGTSRVLATDVIYPTPPQNKTIEAEAKMRKLIETHNVTSIAIGNGTASRESEAFTAKVIHRYDGKVKYMIVNESGASVYSASKLGAEEFPDFDVSLRSAVSIARRMQDPLAELVKIDPKSIGVGQYQHDMPPAELDTALEGVVEDCVNAVGVDLNTASVSLLKYVSGINAAVAKNIVAYREENGAFPDRKTLLKVPKLGKKAYEQCAGFLRIPDGSNILDNTGVHPESYTAVKALMKRCGCKESDITAGTLTALNQTVESVGIDALAEELGIGAPTLSDIVKELNKPGRDIRDDLPPPILRTDVLTMADLTIGMELTGTVRNVIDFGAFVDVGVHEDGLVHISQITNRFIRHPSEVLKVGDIVKVWVKDVDLKRKRLSLTMKKQ